MKNKHSKRVSKNMIETKSRIIKNLSEVHLVILFLRVVLLADFPPVTHFLEDQLAIWKIHNLHKMRPLDDRAKLKLLDDQMHTKWVEIFSTPFLQCEKGSIRRKFMSKIKINENFGRKPKFYSKI